MVLTMEGKEYQHAPQFCLLSSSPFPVTGTLHWHPCSFCFQPLELPLRCLMVVSEGHHVDCALGFSSIAFFQSLTPSGVLSVLPRAPSWSWAQAFTRSRLSESGSYELLPVCPDSCSLSFLNSLCKSQLPSYQKKKKKKKSNDMRRWCVQAIKSIPQGRMDRNR